MLILDISCQHIGDECKLEGFCVPFGHRVGDCTYFEIYICIGYMTPKILGIICHLKIFVDIVYIMPTLGGGVSVEVHIDIVIIIWGGMCNLLGFFGPFGPRVGGMYFSLSSD